MCNQLGSKLWKSVRSKANNDDPYQQIDGYSDTHQARRE